MYIDIDKELAKHCTAELKVLEIRNNLARGQLGVTVLETRSGFILNGITIRKIEYEEALESGLRVEFSNYRGFAPFGVTCDYPDALEPNFAQVVVNAVTSFLKAAMDHVSV
jgi:hypothetical protein